MLRTHIPPHMTLYIQGDPPSSAVSRPAAVTSRINTIVKCIPMNSHSHCICSTDYLSLGQRLGMRLAQIKVRPKSDRFLQRLWMIQGYNGICRQYIKYVVKIPQKACFTLVFCILCGRVPPPPPKINFTKFCLAFSTQCIHFGPDKYKIASYIPPCT